MIGKPYSGKLNVRFDEGELEIGHSLLRQFSTLLFRECPKLHLTQHWRKPFGKQPGFKPDILDRGPAVSPMRNDVSKGNLYKIDKKL